MVLLVVDLSLDVLGDWRILVFSLVLALISTNLIGKKFGDKLGSKAEIVGGIILIIIGLKTFIEYLIEIL